MYNDLTFLKNAAHSPLLFVLHLHPAAAAVLDVLHHHPAAVLAHQLFARLDGRPCTRRQPARSSLHPTAQLSSSDGCSVSVKLQGKMSQIASKVR
jgi:hypothetical protein